MSAFIKNLLLNAILSLGIISGLSSQELIINGKISDAITRETIIGVTILEKGTQNGTISDLDGNFTLKVSRDAILEISYIGYATQFVDVRGQYTLEILLSPESQVLNDVIITGYKKEYRSEVTSSIASIKSKDVEKLVVMGIDQAMQGLAAGVQITQATGAPGDDIAVRIRGVSTFGNNSPLFIIDGVPTTANINTFSVSDIESIDVLKDGAAAAAYGARAANGVVLITTKKGKAGKASFLFDVYSGFSEVYRLPELLNSKEYLEIRNEAITNANNLRPLPNQLKTYDLSILDTLPDNNWLDLMFNKAPIQKYSLSAKGGSEFSNYYVEGEYMNQKGTFRSQGFEKYNVRVNGETGNSWLKVGNNLSFAFTDRKVINSSGDGFGPGNELSGIRYTLIASPLFPVYQPDGQYYNVTSLLGDPNLFGDGNANPLAFVDATDWTIQRSRIFGNIFAEITPIKDLKLRTSLGADLLFENEKKFKQSLSAAIYTPSSLSEGRVFDRNLIWQNTADFNKTFENHKISMLIGMEAIQANTNYIGASVNNFPRTDKLFRYLSSGEIKEINDIGAGGIETEWALLSYFGQLGYVYNNKYVLNTTLRRDGSSRFGPNNRWGLFPSFSLGWNVSNEKFLANSKVISGLKLRASWGRLGNQSIGNYPYSSLLRTGVFVYPFGDKIASGAQLVETGNANLKWETTTQTNVGLDLSLWNERLTIIFDVFSKLSEDILVRVPVPLSGGEQNPPFVNAGSIENKGWELSTSYRQRSGNLNWSIGGNISGLKNKVTSISDGEPILGGFGLSDGPLTRTEPGQPVGSFYVWKMEGIFQNQAEIDAHAFQSKDTRPGDVKFADLNGDKLIDDKDRAHLGSPFPDFIYGVNFSMQWKNFDLSAAGQGVHGNDLYFLYGNFAYETQLRGFNSYRDILNRWTPENPSQTIPKVSVDDRNGNRRPSTRWLYDGSYFRLRNVTLGYTVKSSKIPKFISSVRVYFTGQNLLTFTKYPGLDPEIQANTNDTRGLNISSDLSVGIDWGTVPSARSFIFGLQTGF